MYKDDEFYELSGYRKVADWFGSTGIGDVASWQVFLEVMDPERPCELPIFM